jgi:gamma-glutamylcysteine synthetase
MTTTRDHKDTDGALDAERQREFTSAVLADLRALDRMIAEKRFETGIRRIGAEQELFLLDEQWAPARGVLALLDKLKPDPHYTTELGQFQLEANCDPQVFGGDGLSKMHAQLDHLVGQARTAARELGMEVVLMGILPTMRTSDLGLDGMVPSKRYLQLNKVLTAMGGGKFEFAIKGLDELTLTHDSVMVEACNSSFQVHLQVSPEEFARYYNLAQLLAGPLMSVSSNSPILFGKRLWAETRIALFRQAVDTRAKGSTIREQEARVSFGTRWVRDSVVEIFKEDIARFRPLVGTDLDEDPMAMLDRGVAPQLKALRLHNGTIYRWNRACYGILDGKPHLRIENRIMPAGPSTVDEIANAALWCGLMVELGHRLDDVPRRMDFDQAGANFYTAAREGIGAHFTWLDHEDISARELMLERLLPTAEAGLRRQERQPGRHQALPGRDRGAGPHRPHRRALAAVVVELAARSLDPGRARQRPGRGHRRAPGVGPAGVGVGAGPPRRGGGARRQLPPHRALHDQRPVHGPGRRRHRDGRQPDDLGAHPPRPGRGSRAPPGRRRHPPRGPALHHGRRLGPPDPGRADHEARPDHGRAVDPHPRRAPAHAPLEGRLPAGGR